MNVSMWFINRRKEAANAEGREKMYRMLFFVFSNGKGKL